MFSRSHKLMWLRGLIWNSRRVFKKYIFGVLHALPFFSQVLHLSIAFQRCWKAHGFQQNLRQVDTCHLFTFYCSSAGRKICLRGERLQLCHTQIPTLSHSIIWLFTHLLVIPPCRVSDTSWRVLQVCSTLHSRAGLGQLLFCNEMSSTWREPIQLDGDFSAFVQGRHHILGRVTDQ